TETEWTDRYGKTAPALRLLIAPALAAFDGNLWMACDALAGSLPVGEQDTRRAEWLDAAEALADHSFGGDNERLAYALKDRYLLDKWNSIKAAFTSVPDLGAALREPMRV